MNAKQMLNKGSYSKSSDHYIIIIVKNANVNVKCKILYYTLLYSTVEIPHCFGLVVLQLSTSHAQQAV